MSRLGDELMLCNVSVANLPLREVIPAAAAAGFGCISVLARAHRRAVERDGVKPRELRALLTDHDIAVQEVEAAGDWLGPLPIAEQPWLDPVYDTDRLLDLADELDARTLVATHFGRPVAPEIAADAFGVLCDRAAARGRQVALEFPAMATVSDIAAAWRIVQLADRPNGGLLIDNWHHRRGGGTDDELARVPADRILSIQLSDGTREPSGPPIEDVVHRTLPGTGDLEVVPFLRSLDARGVRCPVGIEVLRKDIVADGAPLAAERLFAALATVVAEARSADPSRERVR